MHLFFPSNLNEIKIDFSIDKQRMYLGFSKSLVNLKYEFKPYLIKIYQITFLVLRETYFNNSEWEIMVVDFDRPKNNNRYWQK